MTTRTFEELRRSKRAPLQAKLENEGWIHLGPHSLAVSDWKKIFLKMYREVSLKTPYDIYGTSLDRGIYADIYVRGIKTRK
ncbi:MAG: hypothetical protein ACP5NS_04415 [Candidatus Pacearchaeota archaeon]